MDKIRVLIVDDSALMRKAIRQILETDPEIEVVGTARDGSDAIGKARELKPDVVTMDINMPSMDGLTSMQYILDELPNVSVLILSSIAEEGALVTFEALELGAFDYVMKPSGTVSTNLYVVGKEIIEKVKVGARQAKRRRISRVAHSNNKSNKKLESSICSYQQQKKDNIYTSKETSGVNAVVVIGISTGGPQTLMEVLPKLPADLNAALLIVQHMPSSFTASFAQRLNNVCQIEIKEAKPGDRLANGKGFLAPGGLNMLVRNGEIRLSRIPETLFMPSVTVTMDSVLECYGGKKVVGVLMTGMGSDGADSMVRIKNSGGITIAEDESTAIVFGMPRVAIENGGASVIAPSYRIADEIVKAVKRLKEVGALR